MSLVKFDFSIFNLVFKIPGYYFLKSPFRFLKNFLTELLGFNNWSKQL